MGNFANSAIRLMLGWARSAASWLWQLIESPEGNTLFDWLGSHWVLLAVLVCVLGIVIDLIVYFFRWRPDLVWRSYFRRRAERKLVREAQPETEDEDYDMTEDERLPLIPRDPHEQTQPQSSSTLEPEQAHERHRRSERRRENRAVETLKRLIQDDDPDNVKPYQPQTPAGSKSDAFHEPYYPPQWKRPGDPDQPES